MHLTHTGGYAVAAVENIFPISCPVFAYSLKGSIFVEYQQHELELIHTSYNINTYTMTRKLLFAALLAFTALGSLGVRAEEAQKREMRTAWIATVANIDWPQTRGTGSTVIAKQKAELLSYIDGFHRINMNAVCLQVRPMADALYKSSYEPWSAYITGTRGKDPGWDPMEYAVAECHKRGMEFHAWVNPYRFSKKGGADNTTEQDEAVKASGVLIDNNGDQVFNPALETSRKRVVDVCREMITNYDIDGIIFDDYFYPGAGLATDSSAPDYELWKSSGTSMSISDWRRANVNLMVREVYDMVQATKPYVKFWIGPAGVAGTASTSASKHNVDPCPTGSDWQYNTIYSDPLAWLEEGTIDIISPQLYWKTNHKTNPFGPLTKWWSYVAHHFGRHHYASHNIYFMASTNTQSDWDEVIKQIDFSRQYNEDNAPGVNFYSAKYINGPTCKGLGDYLKANRFQHQAIIPALTWKPKTSYDAPGGLSLTGNTLSWTGIDKSLIKYAIYAMPDTVSPDGILSSKFSGIKSDYLVALTYEPTYTLPDSLIDGHWYAVSVVDGWNNEFDPSYLNAPAGEAETVTIESPVGGSQAQWRQNFKWSATSQPATFRVQVARDKGFSSIVLEQTGITDNQVTLDLAALESAVTYYWRVTTSQKGKFPKVSSVASFLSPKRESAPLTTLLSPADGAEVADDFVFECAKVNAQTYTVEVSPTADFGNVAWSRDMEETAGKMTALCEVAAIGKGSYYWRVVTGAEYCTDTATSPRSFTITKVPTGNYEPGYVMRRDTASYGQVALAGGATASVVNAWVRSVKEPYSNITFDSNGLCNRGFTLWGDRLLVVGRTENSSGASVYINHYDVTTGERLKSVKVSDDAQVGYYPGNDIFTDNAGNVIISNLTLKIASTPLTLCLVDPETGLARVVASVSTDAASTARIDHCNVWGDVTTGNFTVFAAMASGTQLVRWTIRDGSLQGTQVVKVKRLVPSSVSSLGIAPRVWPVSDGLAYVKGGGTDPVLYDFTSGNVIQEFDSETAVLKGYRQANGLARFSLNDADYIVLPVNDHTCDTGFRFTIARLGDGGTLSGSVPLWTLPDGGLGSVNSQTWNALAAAKSAPDGNSASIYLYVPGNGMAAYVMGIGQSGIIQVDADGGPTVDVEPGMIRLSEKVAAARLLDTAGRTLLTACDTCVVEHSLPRGVYLLRCVLESGAERVVKVVL